MISLLTAPLKAPISMGRAPIEKSKRYHHIDVLRGVAVSLVILNHLDIELFHLGFLGVDIFFVISGFVIFNLVLNQVEQGQIFSVKTFLLKRIKRLFPAFITVTFLTLILSPVFLSSGNTSDAAISSIFSIFNVSNFYFMFTTQYFGLSAIEKPMLHFWSLSVEEQFYLFFPILFIGYLKFTRATNAACAIVFFSSALLFSLSQSDILQVNVGPESSSVPISNLGFYMMPARTFEFLVGMYLCIWTKNRHLQHIP